MGPPYLLLSRYLFHEPYVDIWTNVKITHASIYQNDLYYLLARYVVFSFIWSSKEGTPWEIKWETLLFAIKYCEKTKPIVSHGFFPSTSVPFLPYRWWLIFSISKMFRTRTAFSLALWGMKLLGKLFFQMLWTKSIVSTSKLFELEGLF